MRRRMQLIQSVNVIMIVSHQPSSGVLLNDLIFFDSDGSKLIGLLLKCSKKASNDTVVSVEKVD
jgi:hypothetical protein